MIQQKRTCGECTACCKTHAVEVLGKERGVWCRHCTIGEGCRIYKTRPDACRTFVCNWLMGDWGTDADRPDKSGIVVTTVWLSELDGDAILLWGIDSGSLKQEQTKQITQQFLLLDSLPVLHVYPHGCNRGVIYFPPIYYLAPEHKRRLRESGIEVA